MSLPIKKIALSLTLAASVMACSTVASEAPSAVVRELGDVFLTANLSGSGQGAGIGGTVRAIDLPATEDIQVQVEATGLPAGLHAWHVHAGSCAQQGAVVVPFTPTRQMEGIDEDIRADSNGRGSESSVVPSRMLTQAQLTSGTYSLNIHAGGGVEHGPRIACADL